MSRTITIEVRFKSEWTETTTVEVPDEADAMEVDELVAAAARNHEQNDVEAMRNTEMVDWEVV